MWEEILSHILTYQHLDLSSWDLLEIVFCDCLESLFFFLSAYDYVSPYLSVDARIAQNLGPGVYSVYYGWRVKTSL